MQTRSFVIPVLDFSSHSRYSILTLLDDLQAISGEVICIFNSREVFERLRDHPRIDRFCYNSQNVGVSRSWNQGIDVSEGRTVFICNADLHLEPTAVEEMEYYLNSLPEAVIVGPQGAHIDFSTMTVTKYFKKGEFDQPVQTHDVSGFLFAIHMERYRQAGLAFDGRFTPTF